MQDLAFFKCKCRNDRFFFVYAERTINNARTILTLQYRNDHSVVRVALSIQITKKQLMKTIKILTIIIMSFQGNMKQHMLTHKIRDMPPTFEKGPNGGSIGTPLQATQDDSREMSPERRSTPEKMDLKRSPPIHPPPPLTHPPPLDMPPLPKRPTGT